MGRWIQPGVVTLAVITSFLTVVPSCQSGPPYISPENNLSELEFEKSRAIAALRESVIVERNTISSLKTQEDEKESVLQELAQKETALRYSTDQVRKLTAERADLEKTLAESRESEKKIKESHEKLKDLAFNSTQEMSDLKTRASNAVQAKEKLSAENKDLAKQLDSSNHELEELKAEMTRTRAVVRSFQEHQPLPPGMSGDPALKSRIAQLEKQLAEANASREAGEGGSVAAAVPAPVPVPVAVKPDQQAILDGLWDLTVERVEAAKNGQFQWDVFGWILAAVTTVVVLTPIAALIVLWKGRRYRRQLAELRVRAASGGDDDLDQAVDAVGLGVESPRQGSSRNLEEVPAKAANRRSTYVPREDRDFSAIISSPRKGKERAEAPAAESAPPPPEPVAPVREPAPKKSAEPVRRREEKASAPTPQNIEREQRRAITKVFDEAESKPKPTDEPRAAIPAKAPRVEPVSRAESDDEDDEEMARTQIISPLKVNEHHFPAARPPAKAAEAKKPRVEAKPEPEAAPAAASEDRELLDELKDIINKKFDELMKK